VGLALTWSLDHHATEPLTNRLLWELSLYDPSGKEVGREAGLPHDWAQLDDGRRSSPGSPVSIDRDAPEGVYQVHVDRLDPVTRDSVPASGADAEWSAGAVEVGRN